MLDTQTYLALVRRRGEQGLELTRVYRNMRRQDIFLAAYSNLYANTGAMTPGIDSNDTVDGMSLERINHIIDRLANGTYRWKPVRRTYIEKASSTALRALGLPGWEDKMVQDVIRMILEAYYEPQFRDCSHGFRPKRGCHTALREIYNNWAGVKWFIELDIRKCFDKIDWNVLMNILRRSIKDDRFLKLIREMLEAGYMEDWVYHRTYSGTPQGGICSPLLMNIVLNDLDAFIKDVLIPEYTKGKRRKVNSEYRHWQNMAKKAGKRGDRQGYQVALKKQRRLPSLKPDDPDFARLWYVRYADDSLLGWTGTKAEAETVKERIGEFLLKEQKLEMSEHKTLITHAREEKARFLNYHIGTIWSDTSLKNVNGKKRRSRNGRIRLEIPSDVVRKWKRRIQKGHTTRHRQELIDNSDYEIIVAYETRMQGLINYYSMAHDVVRKMGMLRYLYEQSLVKTLAAKYNTSVRSIYRKYRGFTATGKRVIMVKVEREDKPPLIASYGKKPIRQHRKAVLNDEKPPVRTQRTELLARLLNDECELCGTVGPLVGHHVRKLRDLRKKGRELKTWQHVMIALRRKTLFVCKQCHEDIHGGKYDGRKLT